MHASSLPPAHSLHLQFDQEGTEAERPDAIRGELSAIARVGQDLWLAADEGASIERLHLLDDHTYGHHVRFALGEYVDLPEADGAEVDIEGLDSDGHYLWVVGSHGRKRDKPHDTTASIRKRIKRLSRIERDPNRYLVARIPVARGEDGISHLVREVPAETHAPHRRAKAAWLPMRRKGNALIAALKDDKHLGPFLRIPDKDNGFCIEGLAARDGRLFLGLRGPVLRGWAVILEVHVEAVDGSHALRLRPLGAKGRPYRKHFLDLRGLGIRDLCWDGADLLVLGGPTMVLEGASAVFRWRDVANRDEESLVEQEALERVLDLPHGRGEHQDIEHPEGVVLYSTDALARALLVVYDAPNAQRTTSPAAVRADVFPLATQQLSHVPESGE